MATGLSVLAVLTMRMELEHEMSGVIGHCQLDLCEEPLQVGGSVTE